METVEIPNRATRSPFALSDVMIAAPVLSRLLLRTSLPGQLIGAAAIGAYTGSVFRDWLSRYRVRPVDFQRQFGVDVLSPPPMSLESRGREAADLVERLNRMYSPLRERRRARASTVDRVLTDYIGSITGQRIVTSTEVRRFMLPQLLFPFAVGACDVLSGEVAIFRDIGIFEPHVLAHEFSHRKGYFREVEAQLLAFLSLSSSESAELQQSALAERLYRQLVLLAGRDRKELERTIRASGLRRELASAFLARVPAPSLYERLVSPPMERLYELRMRLTGQNGLSDYDEGFTNALHAIESVTAGDRSSS